jgi:hypothetical protein
MILDKSLDFSDVCKCGHIGLSHRHITADAQWPLKKESHEIPCAECGCEKFIPDEYDVRNKKNAWIYSILWVDPRAKNKKDQWGYEVSGVCFSEATANSLQDAWGFYMGRPFKEGERIPFIKIKAVHSILNAPVVTAAMIEISKSHFLPPIDREAVEHWISA